MSTEHSYWFAAKTYGIGWGMPVTWQGWVVVLAFVALICAGLAMLSAGPLRISVLVALSVVFVGVVVWKGERPFRWRWGRG